MSDRNIDKTTLRWNKIQAYLKTHDYIMNANVRELCGMSATMANRILSDLFEKDIKLLETARRVTGYIN